MIIVEILNYLTFSKWFPEIRQYYKDAPILLVGTKSDIKHQLKYQRKNFNLTKKRISNEDLVTVNTTFQADTTVSLIDVKREVAQSARSSHQYKCSYCTNLKRRTKQRSPETQAKSISIVSRVSHQHIETAQVLLDENNNVNLRPKLDYSPGNDAKTSLNFVNNQLNMTTNSEETRKVDVQALYDEIPKLNLNETFKTSENNENECDDDYDEVCSECDQCNCDDCCCCYSLDSEPEYDIKRRPVNKQNSILTIAGEVNNQTSAANSLLNDSIFNNKTESRLNESNLTASFSPLISKTNMKLSEPILNNTQIDINTVYRTQLIKRSDCIELKDIIKARKYLQCSCLDEISIKNVMENAIKLALDHHNQRIKLEERNRRKRKDFSLFGSKRNKINDEKVDLNKSGHCSRIDEDQKSNTDKKEEAPIKPKPTKLITSPETSPSINRRINRNKNLRCLSCTRSQTNSSIYNI